MLYRNCSILEDNSFHIQEASASNHCNAHIYNCVRNNDLLLTGMCIARCTSVKPTWSNCNLSMKEDGTRINSCGCLVACIIISTLNCITSLFVPNNVDVNT